ncbi:MAG: hypothetical protein ACON35_03330 [Candidatus Marinamargulisbacteria bacterium]
MSINAIHFPDADSEVNGSPLRQNKDRAYSDSSETSTVTADSDFARDNLDENLCTDLIGEVDNNAVIINELINNILINVLEMSASSEEKMNVLLDKVKSLAKNEKDNARIISIKKDFDSLNIPAVDEELIPRLLIHSNDLWNTCGILSLKMIRNLWGYAAYYQHKSTEKVYYNAFSLLFSKENNACLSEVVKSQKNMLEKFKLYHTDLNTDSISRTYSDYTKKYQSYLTAIGSDVKPRSMHILPWILEGVKLIFKPTGACNETDFYQILTRQAFVNFMCDDFADQLRDKRVVNVFREIFPTQENPTLSRPITLGSQDEFLSKQTIRPYLEQQFRCASSQEGALSNVDEKLIDYLSFIWITFYETFDDFYSIVIKEDDGEEDINKLKEQIFFFYAKIFQNFETSLQFNLTPNISTLEDAYKTSPHNMNIVAFHAQYLWFKLSQHSTVLDEIKTKIQRGLHAFSYEQKLGRIGNILATSIPKDAQTLSRELEAGDISGTIEFLHQQLNSLDIDKTRAVNEIFSKIKSQRAAAMEDLSVLITKSNAESQLLSSFIAQSRAYESLLEELQEDGEFDQSTLYGSKTSSVSLLLHHLLSRGKI